MASLKSLFAIALILAVLEVSMVLGGRRANVKSLSNRAALSGHVERDFYLQENPPSLVADGPFHFTEDDEAKCFNVLANDFDIDGNFDPSTIVIYTYPLNGWAAIKQGWACYKPDADYNGLDHFSYSVCDHNNECEWAQVRIVVAAVNDAPVARDDSAQVHADEYSVTINVLENDNDIDGAYVDYHSLRILEQPQNGEVEITADYQVKYTPTWNSEERFYGEDHFVYQVCDNQNHQLCTFARVVVDTQDKCIACEKCQNYLPTFNLHRQWIDGYFHSDVLENL